ncbi:hypothetical protein PPTG_19441 [Phytophthora nicotianae INRA-310]|uniref:Myb/SANT-like domain-containing protein n=1 Tax=Phytophthora nicotianae (strain INRA-310) TaxID=761204 RepID=W2PBV8_PHYN3|nr:hypothetical protein PPTG_19441 [Phytophthora nicotianae INRA-310]ETM98537.1 hypothetical protein PPTG_19441 [Phytophthora nicotianae INRA-310]
MTSESFHLERSKRNMAGDELLHAVESLGETPFRQVDPQKRSRFNQRDCEKLMLIVACRKTYSAPHGTGETEWQGVADELNTAVGASFSSRSCRDKVAALLREHVKASAVSRRASGVAETHTTLSDYTEAYLQLKTSFEEKRNAEKDKKTRRAKRLASAGGKAMHLNDAGLDKDRERHYRWQVRVMAATTANKMRVPTPMLKYVPSLVALTVVKMRKNRRRVAQAKVMKAKTRKTQVVVTEVACV